MSELANYQQRINDLNNQVCNFLSDIPAEGLNWCPPYSEMNSLAALASHIAGAQRFWILQVIDSRTIQRDRESELKTIVSDACQFCQRINSELQEVTEALKNLNGRDLGDSVKAEELDVPIRWGIVHVIDHTALHFGQMQLMYQLWSQGKVKPSPIWKNRYQKS